MAGLLKFDWFRPVDSEDVFLSHIDNLIQQLEELDPVTTDGENVERLIEVLEIATGEFSTTPT